MKKIFSLALLLSIFSNFSQNALSSKTERYTFSEDTSVSLHQLKINFRIISNEIRAYALLMEQNQHDENKGLYDTFKSSEHLHPSHSLIAQNIEKTRSKQPLIKSAIDNYVQFSKKVFEELIKIKETAEISFKKIQKSEHKELSYMLTPIGKLIQDLGSFLISNNPMNTLNQFMYDIDQNIDSQSKMVDISNRLTSLLKEVEKFSNLVIHSLDQHKTQVQNTLVVTNIRNDDRDEFKIRALIQKINQILKKYDQQTEAPTSHVRDNARVSTSLLDQIITHFDLSPYSKHAIQSIQNTDVSNFLKPGLKKTYRSLQKLGVIEDGLSALQSDSIISRAVQISEESSKGEKNLINPLILHIKSGSIHLQNQNRSFLQTVQDLKNNFDKTKRDILTLSRELYNTKDKYSASKVAPENAKAIDVKILKYLDIYTTNQGPKESYSTYDFSSDFHQNNIDFINSSLMTNSINRKYMNMILYMIDMKLFIQNIQNYVENSLIIEFRKITKSYQRLIKIVQYFQNNSTIFAQDWKNINIDAASGFFESIQDIEKINMVSTKSTKSNINNSDEDEDEYNFSRVIQSIDGDAFEELDVSEIDKLTDQELILRIKSLEIGNTILADIESVTKEEDSLNKFLAEKERLEPKYEESYRKTNEDNQKFIRYAKNVERELLSLIQFKKDIKKYYSQIIKDQTVIDSTGINDISKKQIKQFRADLKNLMQYVQIDTKKKQVTKSFEQLTAFVIQTLGEKDAYELKHSYKADFVNMFVQGLSSFLSAASNKQ